MNDQQFDQRMKETNARQLKLAKLLYMQNGPRYVANLKNRFEMLVGPGGMQKHSTHDSIFYIENCGLHGYRAIKFYNDGVDFRIGSFCASASEAYNEALGVL